VRVRQLLERLRSLRITFEDCRELGRHVHFTRYVVELDLHVDLVTDLGAGCLA
jgi:hypothetical protein